MDEHSPLNDHISLHAGIVGGGIAGSSWLVLLICYPVIWAILTGLLLMMLFGLFTAKFMFGIRSMWTALGVAPLLGTCWLALFYALFRVMNS